MTSVQIGKIAEDLAIDFLIARGLKFITRNFYTPFGEIDIIMADEIAPMLVFVEVKSRQDEVDPIVNISKTKALRIFKSIEYFLISSPRIKICDYRFDFVGINLNNTHKRAYWIKDLEVEYE